MKSILAMDMEENSNFRRSSSRSLYKDEEGSIIPISKIDDYQRSMSNFSTRKESDKKPNKKGKKKVEFNPLISVVNIESFKKQNSLVYNENDTSKEKEKKCEACVIF